MPQSAADNLLIFDLDGVITSEEAYWDTAGLVVHELLYSPRYWNIDATSEPYQPVRSGEESRRVSRQLFPEAVIMELKARAVNSNWDTCYAGFCLYLIELLALLPDPNLVLPLRPADADWIALLREQLAQVVKPLVVDIGQPFSQPPFRGYRGLELLKRFNEYASERLGVAIVAIFERYSPSWLFCQNLFQEWYLGERLYTQEYDHAPAQPGKPGCILFEEPLLPVEQLRTALEALRQQGYVLGVATGRPGQEAILPLKNYGLYHYFAEQHVMTHAEVEQAQQLLRATGDTTYLGKPHPFQFLRAANPAYQPNQPLPPRDSFIVVGDTPSDIFGGRSANALTIAVLTGSRTAEARRLLEASQPDFIVDDITRIPELLARIDDLATIQRMQFTQRAKAEMLLRRWFARHMQLRVNQVALDPKPVSLNSFNGIYGVDEKYYFFKTHIEEQGVLEEYYHAEMLHNAGYRIVRPLHTLHESGQQMVIYPVVHDPVMFDLMRAVETGQQAAVDREQLLAAEQRECERLLQIYERTLKQSSAQEHAQAPIHQLFWHRLVGGRYKDFYQGKRIAFPGSKDGEALDFAELLNCYWTINGKELRVQGERHTLGQLVERAKDVLQPERATYTIIGHGDAHFGNVFLEQQRDYRYFDPAFAGRHSPLLDIVKPLFHNVFAMWMYFPQDVVQQLQMSVERRGNELYLEHNYHPTPLRQALLATKLTYLLPHVRMLLRQRDALPEESDEILRAALLCCPLLTVNLLDAERFPIEVSWLGFAYAVEMGHFSFDGGRG